MQEFRITLSLHQFFSDHRSICRLFINKNMKTIEDVTEHICSSFNIDTKFYLTCNNLYLPVSEDVRVLKEDDVLCAIAYKDDIQDTPKQQLFINTPQEKSKKSKKRKHTISESPTNNEAKSVSKVSNKDDEGILYSIEGSSCKDAKEKSQLVDNGQQMIKSKKKKSKKSRREIENSPEKLELREGNKDDSVSIKQSSIIDSLTKYNSSDPFKNANPYSCISNFKAPRKKHVPLMEISTIPKVIHTIHVRSLPDTSNTSRTDNFVASPVIDSNNIQFNNVSNERLEIEKATSEYIGDIATLQETARGVTSETNLPENFDNKVVCGNVELPECKSQTTSFDMVQTITKLQLAKESLLQQIKAKYGNRSQNSGGLPNMATNDNSIVTSDLDSESITGSQQMDTEDTSTDFVKRKRKRVRRRKKHQPPVIDSKDFNTITRVQLPIVAPKSSSNHIRFNDVSPHVVSEINEHTSDSIKSKTISIEEPALNVPFDHLNDKKLQKEDILKYPTLDGKLPKKGDILAFKMLVMSETYTPVVSEFIVGLVLNFNPFTNTVLVKYLEGNEQCHTPDGKFLMDNCDTETHEEQELNLNVLLELRLLYP